MSTTTAAAAAAATTTSSGVSNQAGVLEGLNPTIYNKNDPIVLFIIQVCSSARLVYPPR